MAANETLSTLFLGRSANWWDWAMLSSLGITAVAAIAVGLFTTGSVMANKREAQAAELARAKLQTETDGKVADAKLAGIAAGERAGHAQAVADAATVQIEKAKVRAALFSKLAADANLKAEEIKKQVSWRDLTPPEAQALAESLSHSPLTVTIDWIKDPEVDHFTAQIAHALGVAGVNLKQGKSILAGDSEVGIRITGQSAEALRLQKAFKDVGVDSNVSEANAELTLKIGLKPRPIF